MKFITANKLNRFWQKGIKPIKDVLGEEDISALGDGTVTGALCKLKESISNITNGIAFRDYTGNTTLTNLLNSLSAPCICMTTTENISDKPSGKYGTIVVFKQSNNRTGAICLCTDGTFMHNIWNSSTSTLNGWK